MYQLLPETEFGPAQCIKRLSDNAFIPFDPDNTDCAQFKVDLENGVPLQDADGNNMTKKQIEEFLSTLP